MARRYCSILLTCLLACSLPMLGCNDGSVTLNDQDNSQKDKNKDKNKDKDKNKTGDEGNTGDDGKNKPGDDDEDNTGDDDKNKPGDDDKNKPGDEDKQKTCIEPDEDGDTISDEHEGRAEERDTDGDGTPDYKDEDSDGDTIPDKVEARNGECSGETPEDMDNDGLPNYLDDDSDDNGIPDSAEAGADPTNPVDTDGDGTPDFVSDDNDGDGTSDQDEILGLIKIGGEEMTEENFSGDCDGDTLPDARGTLENPVDCDKDGVYDYLDKDSDGDTLPDSVEKDIIIGKYYARYSKDADGNGISDYAECAGKMTDAEVTELPETCVDTDGDGTPDFLDVDNDGDSLPDTYEIEHSSNINNQDSDGDGANDLIEIGAGTDPANPDSNPEKEGNFVFTVPYKKPAEPSKRTLSFATSVQTVDVYFSIDQSGSMFDDINTLRTNLPQMLNEMYCKELGPTCTENKDCELLNGGNAICSEGGKCIVDPSYGDGCFANMWTGLGWWGDLNRYRNALSLQPDPQATVAALGNRPSLGASENCIQAAACASEGSVHCTNPDINCYSGAEERVGCVGFRKDAIKILVQAGDEANDEWAWGGNGPGQYTVANAAVAGQALKNNKIRFIGLWGETEARDFGVKQIACEAGSCAAGSNCAANCQNITPAELSGLYIAQTQGSTINQDTIKMIKAMTKNMNMHITSTAEDIDEGAAQLVAALNVNITDAEAQGKVCTKVSDIIHTGKFEEIAKLQPGLSVCYDVVALDNQEFFKPTKDPLVLKARIKVMGDGSTLNSGIAYFLIPPVFEEEIGIN